jgi:hypothetical protein
MPRIFTGLEIPDNVAQSLAMMRGGLPGARWIDPENYHVTLRFIGDVDDQTELEVASLLARVRRKPFELKFDMLSSFGGRRPRAVIATLAQTAALMELQAEHERLMQRVAARNAGAAARLLEPGCRRLSRLARPDRIAAVHGFALRAVLVARLDRRRALCGGSGLSAGGMIGSLRRSFPRKRESRIPLWPWVPAFAGTSGVCVTLRWFP